MTIARMRKGKLMLGGSLMLAPGHGAAYTTEEDANRVLSVDKAFPNIKGGALDMKTYPLRGLPHGQAGSVAAAYDTRINKNQAAGQRGASLINGQGIASLSDKLRNLEIKRV